MKAAISKNGSCRRSRQLQGVEMLEPRTLLSAWSIINTFSYPGGPNQSYTHANGMAQDGAGNIYAIGRTYDSTGTDHGIVQEHAAGSPLTSWTTIEDLPNAHFTAITVDSAGDLFVCGGPDPMNSFFVAVRPAGASNFTVVNDPVGGYSGPGLTLDGSGNAFLAGTVLETVNGVSQQHWLVQKTTVAQLLNFQSAFTTVDDFFYKSQSDAHSGTYVPSGTSAGLYVTGSAYDGSKNYWIVRKSSDDGNTWSTIDNFVPSGTFSYTSSSAQGISGDLTGNNVYVVGPSTQSVKVHNKTTTTSHWIVRKSSDGGATWTVVDDFSSSTGTYTAWQVRSDLLGNMYVVGQVAGSTTNAVVRANTGTNGSWVTVDNYSAGSGTSSYYYNVFVDSSNNHYACGNVETNSTSAYTWLIRSDASTAASPAAVAAVFSSTQVSGSTTDPGDILRHPKRRHG